MIESNIKKFVLGMSVGVGGATLINHLETTYPRYSYASVPDISPPFKIADWLLENTFMRFKRIYAHHWHWETLTYDSKFDEFKQKLAHAQTGNPQSNPFFGAIAHLGGRPYGYLMDLDREDSRSQGVKDFFIGFNWDGAEIIRRCKLKLKEQFFMLAGPDTDCNVYAMDEEGNPLPLKRLTNLIHRNQMPQGVRVL